MCVVLCVYVCVLLGRMCVVLQAWGACVSCCRCWCCCRCWGRCWGWCCRCWGGAGAGPSPLITVHPPTKLYFRQSRATPEPENKYIFNDTGTTPEGQTRYLPGMISKRYGTQLSGRVVPSVLPRCALRLTTLCLMSCHFVPSVLPRALRLTALCLASYRVMPNVLPLCA